MGPHAAWLSSGTHRGVIQVTYQAARCASLAILAADSALQMSERDRRACVAHGDSLPYAVQVSKVAAVELDGGATQEIIMAYVAVCLVPVAMQQRLSLKATRAAAGL